MTQENHSNEVLCGALMSLDLDAVQSCDGVHVLPLRSNLTSAMSYLTLSEAMAVHQLTVRRIDGNLTGTVDRVTRLHRLRVRPNRLRGIRSRYDFHGRRLYHGDAALSRS